MTAPSAAPRGLRARRHLPALAGQDDHRGRRPPLLHADDEPPPPAHERVVRRARDGARAERRRGQPRLLARARDVRARRSGSCIANLEVESLRHQFPTFHGDTIYAETRVLDKSAEYVKARPGDRVVETKAFNQRGEEVCYFRRKLMVWTAAALPPRRRPTVTTSGADAPRGPTAALRRRWGLEVVATFPWRRTRDPWASWSRSCCRQQTQAVRAVAAYERCASRLPDACGMRRRAAP